MAFAQVAKLADVPQGRVIVVTVGETEVALGNVGGWLHRDARRKRRDSQRKDSSSLCLSVSSLCSSVSPSLLRGEMGVGER